LEVSTIVPKYMLNGYFDFYRFKGFDFGNIDWIGGVLSWLGWSALTYL